MFIKNLNEIEKQVISGEGIKNVEKQVPIGPDQGWADHVMRVFTIKPNGHTPKHSHDWPHFNYVISGKGTLEIDGKKNYLPAGQVAVVPANVEHQYSNGGSEDFVMICIVPKVGDY